MESEGIISSLELADYIRERARDGYGVELNKTQVNKLLYMCYGLYLAIKGKQVVDERPKAWPFGPVFPRVYKRFAVSPGVSKPEVRAVVQSNQTLSKVVEYVVKNFHNWTARQLTEWSHAGDGPWYRTAYPDGYETNPKWNTVIDDDYIKEYFGRGNKQRQ